METSGTLEHLLEIEAEAAALVESANAEAERRIFASDEKNRAAFEERFREETQKHEEQLKSEIDKLEKQYIKELDDYRAEISGIKTDTEKFSALLNKYLSGKEG